MRQVLFILFISMAALNVSGQTPWEKNRDSLLKVLAGSKEDTSRVWAMLWLGYGYADNKPDSAVYYAKAFGILSKRLRYPVGMAYSLSMQAMLFSNQDKQDEALALDLEAVDIGEKAHLKIPLANLYNNTAIIYSAKGDPSESLEYYLKAAAVYKQTGDSGAMAFIYSNISGVYNDLKEYQSGYSYALKGVTLCRSQHQKHGFGAGMVNLSCSLINLRRFDSALVVLYETKEFAMEANDKNELVDVMANIDYAYVGLGKFSLIKANAEELMSIAKSVDNNDGICYALFGLVEYSLNEKQYTKAGRYALNALQIAQKSGLIHTVLDAYKEASEVELAKGNVQGYERYDASKDSIEAIILSDKILKNTQELEAKYSLNQKQSEIDDLNKQQKIQELTLRQRDTMNWALAISVLVMALIGFMYSRNYRQKKNLLLAKALLQQQRIIDFERETQLMAAQAVLQGQVQERTRLAKDLHDGLGSILSSTKYSFAHMKDHMVITKENAGVFERSMSMLDRSINELRRVAHNMMPEALMKFGLDTALKDFCGSIEQSGAVQLTYQSFGLDELPITEVYSAAVYRIVQELVNNILKHADATTALVQLIRKRDSLSITVEDNGKGFDTNNLQNNNGIGYLNLRNRVTYLNGTLDIQTEAGKGTSVNIELSNMAA